MEKISVAYGVAGGFSILRNRFLMTSAKYQCPAKY